MCCGHCGIAGVEPGLLLVQLLAAGKTTLSQLAKALELLAGQQPFTLAQLHVGFVGGQGLAGAQHFGLGLCATGFQGAGVHARQQLALGHPIAFVDQYFGQAPRGFGCDLYFSGFKPTVTHADAFRKAVVLGFPITEPACCDQQGSQRDNEIMGKTVIARHADILCHRAL